MTLIWSPEAIDDLASLRAYISVDDPAAAKRAAPLLANNPQLGQHGDKHRVISGVCWRRAAYGTQIGRAVQHARERSVVGSRFLMLNPQPARGDNDTGRRKNRNERRPLP
jgi:plasmid stabilization system protein ParE